LVIANFGMDGVIQNKFRISHRIRIAGTTEIKSTATAVTKTGIFSVF